MHLVSPAFFIGGTIPYQYTCDGDEISPPLSWDEPPEGTSTFALIVEDTDAPQGSFTHWLVYDMPPNLRHLPEGVPNLPKLPNGGVQGKNDYGHFGYGGACPPDGTHRYFFKLYALDQILGLEAGASKAQVEAAMEGHILDAAQLMGRYAKQG